MSNDLGLQYIMDGNGNYYTLNSNDQLVVARNRDEAAVFTFFEANQRIGGGKKAAFYQTIPVDMTEQAETEMMEEAVCEEINNVVSMVSMVSMEPAGSNVLSIIDRVSVSECGKEEIKESVSVAQPAYEYCMEHTDWKEFTNYFIYLASGAKGYQEELAKQHSEIEKEICDLLHYVELYDLSDAEGLKAMDMLKDARQRRRDIKDEISRTEFFQRMLGTSANVAKAKGFLTELKKLDTRKYHPRHLGDLFVGMEDRATDRDQYRQMRMEQNDYVEDDYVDYTEEEEAYEMHFEDTVFDHKENDWLGFSRQQMEFYQNVGQYMMNLQIEIGAIDESIEEIMEAIEDANYNVTQGYKVFKELKDLRNERKAKAQELDVLRTMTECFDINSMADALAYNVDEIERIMVPTLAESAEHSPE